MPLTPHSLAEALIATLPDAEVRGTSSAYTRDNGDGEVVLDGTFDLTKACSDALDKLRERPDDLIPPELRLAAAILLTPALPAEASAWAEQGMEAAFIGPKGMTIDQMTLNGTSASRAVRVRELLYDFLKANEPGQG